MGPLRWERQRRFTVAPLPSAASLLPLFPGMPGKSERLGLADRALGHALQATEHLGQQLQVGPGGDRTGLRGLLGWLT